MFSKGWRFVFEVWRLGPEVSVITSMGAKDTEFLRKSGGAD